MSRSLFNDCFSDRASTETQRNTTYLFPVLALDKSDKLTQAYDLVAKRHRSQIEAVPLASWFFELSSSDLQQEVLQFCRDLTTASDILVPTTITPAGNLDALFQRMEMLENVGKIINLNKIITQMQIALCVDR